MLRKYVVIFHNGNGKVLWGKSKEDIRQKYQNVRSVFKMGIKHE